MGPTSPALSTLAVSEKTPRLSLSLTGWRQLSARIDNWPANAISVMIKREEDGSGRPCVFKWSPLDLVLRIYPSSREEGTEAPVTQPQGLASDESGLSAPFSVPSADLIELWPGAEATVHGTIPEKYGPMLRVGGQYEVVWPGATSENGPEGRRQITKPRIGSCPQALKSPYLPALVFGLLQ
jgi:hypothetical protein